MLVSSYHPSVCVVKFDGGLVARGVVLTQLSLFLTGYHEPQAKWEASIYSSPTRSMLTTSSPSRQPTVNTFTSHGWNFTSTKAPIASIPETESLSAILQHPTPTMLFSSNALTITNPHLPLTLSFSCVDALMYLDETHIGMKVHNESMDAWTRAKYAVHKPYDWTFSTLYQGQFEGPFQEYPGGKLDYDKLKTSKDINFYDEVIMYEDELADNGASIYSVKLRVMDFGWFVLARHYLRVDKVCTKTREVRFYHQFGETSITKELRIRETHDSFPSKKTVDETVAELPITVCQTFCIRFVE